MPLDPTHEILTESDGRRRCESAAHELLADAYHCAFQQDWRRIAAEPEKFATPEPAPESAPVPLFDRMYFALIAEHTAVAGNYSHTARSISLHETEEQAEKTRLLLSGRRDAEPINVESTYRVCVVRVTELDENAPLLAQLTRTAENVTAVENVAAYNDTPPLV